MEIAINDRIYEGESYLVDHFFISILVRHENIGYLSDRWQDSIYVVYWENKKRGFLQWLFSIKDYHKFKFRDTFYDNSNEVRKDSLFFKDGDYYYISKQQALQQVRIHFAKILEIESLDKEVSKRVKSSK